MRQYSKRQFDDVKVIANYLPQYHRIPENDRWWGEGYTDWTAVMAAKPLFHGHSQPKRPLDGWYYALDDVDSIAKQARIARTAGVYGFGIYHYWFSSSLQLLSKPVELLVGNPDIDINFMLIWDNNSWRRTWSNVEPGNDWAPMFDGPAGKDQDNGFLARLEYGGPKEWEEHFDYLLPIFQDSRYITLDDKPAFGFMVSHRDSGTLKEMAMHWDRLAKASGLKGVACMSQETPRTRMLGCDLPYRFRYESLPPNSLSNMALRGIEKLSHHAKSGLKYFDYDKEWKRILRSAKNSGGDVLLSGIVDYDDTPRRGENGSVMLGASPEKFYVYVRELLRISKTQGKEYIFLSAWNEWGEGMYLEPDEENGHSYLAALKAAIEDA